MARISRYTWSVIMLAAVRQPVAATAVTTTISAVDLAFVPATATAMPGTVLEFHFQAYNHSAVMGNFNSPCMPAENGGFASGFWPAMEGENATVFRVTINDTNPIVYYCSQPIHSHCQSGMIGFINSNDTAAQSAYVNGAQSVNNVGSPTDIYGGVLAANPNVSAVVTSSAGSETGTPTSTNSAGASASSPTTTSGAASLVTEGTFKALLGSGILAFLTALMLPL